MKKFLKILVIVIPIIAAVAYFGYQRYPVNPPVKVSSSSMERNFDLQSLKLPEGFKIEIYADEVVNARSISLSPKGTLFVGTRKKGDVYALQDTDQDGIIDKQHILLEDHYMPNGVAIKEGNLYVAEVNRILKFSDIESKLENPGKPEVIFDDYPSESHHGWKYIAFGPDGRLYVPVGAPCNICKSDDAVFASITSMKDDGTDMRIEHEGIRNTVGFDWNPNTGELYFTDNGRDWMGDDRPECELNKASQEKMHFGYPYCHQGTLLDDEFGKNKNCEDYTAPILNMGPHTAPLGMEFYEGAMFPEEYKGDIFVARHGSWNRAKKIGYDIVRVTEADNGETTMNPFITGWLQGEEVSGRPVDIETMPDGSILISDDYADVIYRVSYKQ